MRITDQPIALRLAADERNLGFGNFTNGLDSIKKVA
jgi:hypothetical protein